MKIVQNIILLLAKTNAMIGGTMLTLYLVKKYTSTHEYVLTSFPAVGMRVNWNSLQDVSVVCHHQLNIAVDNCYGGYIRSLRSVL